MWSHAYPAGLHVAIGAIHLTLLFIVASNHVCTGLTTAMPCSIVLHWILPRYIEQQRKQVALTKTNKGYGARGRQLAKSLEA